MNAQNINSPVKVKQTAGESTKSKTHLFARRLLRVRTQLKAGKEQGVF
jgi:hypothetical protein